MRCSKNRYNNTVGFPLLLSILLFFVVGAGCKKGSAGKQAPQIDSTYIVEIIGDTNFINGIGLQGTNSAQPGIEEILSPFGENASTPFWTLAQWGSKHDLYGAKPQKESNGSFTYSNIAKKINFWHTQGTTQVSMEVFASKEYDAPRKSDENWPGLLLGQNFHSKVHLTTIKALIFEIDARLMYVHNKMGNAYNSAIHTAQCTLFLSIQNRNKNSSGYGDYFWFGLPFYDYRYEHISHSESKDYNAGGGFGTGKFIYDVAGENIYKGSFHDEKWKDIKVDISPFIKEAFQEAREKGYLKTSQFNDMVISGMNVGWEMPGTFDAGFQFKGFSLTATVKK